MEFVKGFSETFFKYFKYIKEPDESGSLFLKYSSFVILLG